MPSSDVDVKEQAHKLLQTLCNCLLPIVQGTLGQTTNAKEIHFGIEADEFATELAKFVTSMISRQRSQDIVIEASLEKFEKFEKSRGDNFEGTSRLSEVITLDERGSEERMDEVLSGGANPDQIAVYSSAMELAMPQPMPLSSDNNYMLAIPQPVPLMSDYESRNLQRDLQGLRKRLTTILPIRLLHFEPHNGKLKISLLERAGVCDYFALKFQAAFCQALPHYYLGSYSWQKENVHYAILSHTWSQIPGELTYGDWHNGSIDDTHGVTHPKYQKLVNFCKASWNDQGITLGWIDTVCINKGSSAELDESIRSMYKWYSSARVCITYLAATNKVSDMHDDPWFTRGWTLQELVAPKVVKFYNMQWNKLSDATNDKDDSTIRQEIQLVTTITSEELNDSDSMEDKQSQWQSGRISISRRMQLAAKREVTRSEDLAYCLMGIFNVSISTAYGEGGNRAFFRLVEEIFRSTKDIGDIFNCLGDHQFSEQQRTSLFPSHPSDYLNRIEEFHSWRPIEPLTLTHLGLRIPILLMCTVPNQGSVLPDNYLLIGDYYATVQISIPTFLSRWEGNGYAYHLLDSRRLDGPQPGPVGKWHPTRETTSIRTLGILNVEEEGTNIHIPKACLAVLLESTGNLIENGKEKSSSPGYKRIHTAKPIVFPLQKTENDSDDNSKGYYELERGELAKHGMKLEILYL